MDDSQIKIEDKVYSFDQLLATGFDVDSYDWVNFTGTYDITIASKCWGRKKQSALVVVCGILKDGRKVKFTCWQQRKPPYNGVTQIPINTCVRVTFNPSRKSGLGSVSSLEPLPLG